MKTMEVLERVLAGKRMSESSKLNLKAVFKSLGAMYEEFPSKPVEVNEWLVSLDGYAEHTVRLWFSMLRSAYEYMEANYEMVNACKAVKSPKVKKQRRRYHKADDLTKIIGACRSDLETGLIMTLIDSACRIGGLSKLKGEDVGDGWIEVKEKTGERRYRLDARLCGVLKRLADGDENLVFGLSDKALSMRVIRISRRAGLKGDKLGPHTIRHSSASLVADETKSALAVKALLQHDNIQTSMLYVHDVEEELQKSISPLKLVGDRVSESGIFRQKRLAMKAGSDSDGGVEGEVVVENEVDELIGDMFPDISDDIIIHSRLRSEDLRLIRKAFISLAGGDRFGRDVGEARLLMKRMLRKVK